MAAVSVCRGGRGGGGEDATAGLCNREVPLQQASPSVITCQLNEYEYYTLVYKCPDSTGGNTRLLTLSLGRLYQAFGTLWDAVHV